jgi:hypothetical protein
VSGSPNLLVRARPRPAAASCPSSPRERRRPEIDDDLVGCEPSRLEKHPVGGAGDDQARAPRGRRCMEHSGMKLDTSGRRFACVIRIRATDLSSCGLSTGGWPSSPRGENSACAAQPASMGSGATRHRPTIPGARDQSCVCGRSRHSFRDPCTQRRVDAVQNVAGGLHDDVVSVQVPHRVLVPLGSQVGAGVFDEEHAIA